MRTALLLFAAGCFSKPGPPQSAAANDARGPIADGGPDATPDDGNFAFVTSQLWPANQLGGRAGADMLCSEAAINGNLAGTYRAFLATTTDEPNESFLNSGGWTQTGPQRLPIAQTLQYLQAGKFFYPMSHDEHGNEVTDGKFVWTGAFPTSLDDTCNDWTSTTGMARAGHYDAEQSAWMGTEKIGCSTNAHLYCARAGNNVKLDELTDLSFPYIFVSDGIATALGPSWLGDVATMCEAEAQNGGIVTNRPWLALLGANAPTNSTYQRPDHVVVTLRADGTLTAPIALGPGSDKWVESAVYTNATSATACSDWTDKAGSPLPSEGDNDFSYARWANNAQATCDEMSPRVYCANQ